MTKQDKFKQLLKTIFQYSKDKIDLDFGVYKVFKNNEKEIYEFVENRLPIFLEEQFNKINIEKNITIEDCYNDILNFFMKYYEGGDFYPAQYFSPNSKKHMLRHNGEEVIFSWANKDQYYIKSLSNFNDYTFEAPKEWFDGGLIIQSNIVVHFKMDTENIDELTGNKKDTRNYVLLDDKTELNDDGLFIYFGFKNGTSVTSEILYNHLKEKSVNINSIDEIEHHIKKFINVRKSDFFIHKNLYKFLTEELDYYIKSEIIDIDKSSTLTRARIVKIVAEYIIEFLSRLEELQRVLWEKKKFAYDVNYIITLDKINKELLAKIINHPNFQNQKDEWIDDLNLINRFDELILYTDNLLQELNPEYKYLPLDTKHFDDDILKYEILEQFENLDDKIDGILINSDNFHGLNYLQKRFKEKVKCVYIDPPFNTGSDENFAYKDNFQSSSWLSLMENRINLVKSMIHDTGSFYLHLDYNANYLGRMIMDSIFQKQLLNQIVWLRTRAAHSDATYFGRVNDTIFLYGKNSQVTYFQSQYSKHKVEYLKRFSKKENNRKYMLVPLHGPGQGPARLFFGKEIMPPKGRCWPSQEKINQYIKAGIVELTSEGTPSKKSFLDENKGSPISDWWGDINPLNPVSKERVQGSFTQKPEALLERIIKASSDTNLFVLDFFSGSGTTINTAHKLGRYWIGIEMGEHFNNVNLPRIKKTIYGIKSGISEKLKKENQLKIGGMIKYYSLEQYEDTLHNTSFTNNTLNSKLTTLDKYKETLPYLYENKFISLAKDVSLQNSPSLLLQIKDEFLCEPFNYTLEIYKENKFFETKVDLVESFNTLMGFEINSIKQKFFSLNNKRYLFVDAKKEVIIWREVSKGEINEAFIKQEEDFIKEHIDTTKKIYMNGINSYYPKTFLDAQATETLYAFRKILMDGVKGGN